MNDRFFPKGNNDEHCVKIAILAFLLCVFMLFTRQICSADALENFSGGSGVANDPYRISNVSDIVALSECVALNDNYRSSYYLQTEDIDLSSIKAWIPIGISEKNAFSGVYDGGGYKIKKHNRILVNDKKQSLISYGLFGVVSGDRDNAGIVRNVHMENAFDVAYSLEDPIYYGAIVGKLLRGQLMDCTVEGEGLNIHIRGQINLVNRLTIGGLVGVAMDGMISNCVNNAPIYVSHEKSSNVDAKIGGIVGSVRKIDVRYESCGVIRDSQNNGSINISSSWGNIGGIVGNSDAIINNCSNSGNLSVKSEYAVRCGGISGSSSGHMTKCYNKGSIQVNDSKESLSDVAIGGIVGEAYSHLVESMNYGAIKVEVNYKNKSGALTFDTGSYKVYLSVEVACGGLVGKLEGFDDISMLNSINVGNVTGIISSVGLPTNIYLGGAVGYTEIMREYYVVNIQNILNIGKVGLEKLTVDINTWVGGVVGFLSFHGMSSKSMVQNCYWLTGSAPDWEGSGVVNDIINNIVMLTSSEWGKKDIFVGLDFENIWDISKGELRLPVLKVFSEKF